jgi:hypothetical protein
MYTMIALVSDYDCWKEHPKGRDKHDLLKEIPATSAGHRQRHRLVAAVLRGHSPARRRVFLPQEFELAVDRPQVDPLHQKKNWHPCLYSPSRLIHKDISWTSTKRFVVVVQC